MYILLARKNTIKRPFVSLLCHFCVTFGSGIDTEMVVNLGKKPDILGKKRPSLRNTLCDFVIPVNCVTFFIILVLNKIKKYRITIKYF